MSQTSPGLVAAMIIGMGLKQSGQFYKTILAKAGRGNPAGFTIMKEAVNKLEPNFTNFINSQPHPSGNLSAICNGHGGIIKIVQKAQQQLGWL